MDGFDDLLAPTRDALEKNPFADPFGKRSSSPDPWTSFQNPSSSLSHDVGGFEDPGHFPTPTLDSPAFGGMPASGFRSYSSSEDPLEPKSAHEEENIHDQPEETRPPETSTEPTGPLSPQSPGFRESISAVVEEDVVPSKPPPEPRQPSPPIPTSPIAPSVSSSATSPITSSVQPTPFSSTFQDSSAPPPSPFSVQRHPAAERPFYSPLEQPTSSLDRSFTGLSLGGETVNGWQGSQSMFVGSTKPLAADDDDDDKPIMQTLNERALSSAGPSSPQPKGISRTGAGDIAPLFTITVDDPQRVGDPIRGYTLYTVHTLTSSPLYSKASFSVLRRYSDFLWLYETLSANNPGVVVPPVPEKSPFNRFDSSFVQQRRLALERCIQKMANHPVLQRDSDLKLFLECDNFALEIKHRKAEIAHEKGGLMATIGQTISGPRFHETDEWFDKQKAYLDSLEVQLRGLVKSIDLVSKQRTELATSAGDFATAVAELASSDVGLGPQLAGSLSGLAAVERKAQELQDKQAEEDTLTIMSTADEYARLINSVRLAFSGRVRTYGVWQAADANVKRVKQAHESNRALGKIAPDQLNRSLAAVADAERRALESKQEFDNTSRLLKAEIARFEQERIEDFKSSLEAFLDGMISRQKELIATWENFQQNLLKRAPQPQQQRATPQPSGLVES